MALPTLVTSKVHSHESGDFSETTEFTVLHCANITGNNNKFYCIEIQRNPANDEYRLFSHYGRLGVGDGALEIRQVDKAGDSLDQSRCKTEYDKIIKKKQRGKKVKRGAETIHEAYSAVEVLSPTVGSDNIRNASEVTVSAGAPMVNTSKHDKESGRLIKSIIAENIHNITSTTSINFTSRGFETPLGPVTENHLDRASDALNTIRDELNGYDTLDSDNKEVREMNGEYMSLIPRKVSHIIQSTDMILTPDVLAAEYGMLDNLRTAVRAGLNTSDDAPSGVDIQMALMARNHDDWVRLERRFETSKHRNHSAIVGYKVKNVFTLDIPEVTRRYLPVEAQLGNVEELFHGTKTANMLSIALNGLIIPPTGAAHVTGRMFGNGIYGANCSSKALNYAVGYWGGQQNRSTTAYVLITKFAMGKTHEAFTSNPRGAPSGYDSVWAKAGRSLLNDELIVYNTNQATITHILELEK